MHKIIDGITIAWNKTFSALKYGYNFMIFNENKGECLESFPLFMLKFMFWAVIYFGVLAPPIIAAVWNILGCWGMFWLQFCK